MYIYHAFGTVQLIFVKIVHLLVKIARGSETCATCTQKCGTERHEDLEDTFALRAAASLRKLSKQETRFWKNSQSLQEKT